MNEYLENAMTVEELVRALQKCPKDFKVQARICTGWSPFPDYDNFTIDQVSDIGYSDKVVILSGEKL